MSTGTDKTAEEISKMIAEEPLNSELAIKIGNILKNGIKFSPQLDGFVVTGAIEELLKSHEEFSSLRLKEVQEQLRSEMEAISNGSFSSEFKRGYRAFFGDFNIIISRLPSPPINREQSNGKDA